MTLASSPGKIMLAGEYAVLEGGRALAHTVGRRLTVHVASRSPEQTWISSDLWSEKKIYDPGFQGQNSGDLTCQALKYFEDQFGTLPPLEIQIESEIVVSHGIGSSSALRLSLFAALQKHLRLNLSPLQIAQLAYGDQKRAQGQASGYDTLTQALGGLIEMSVAEKTWPGHYRKTISSLLKHTHIMTGGKGAPTSETLKSVSEWLRAKQGSNRLLALSEDLVDTWLGEDLSLLLEKIESHRLFFEDAPRFPRNLRDALKPYQDPSLWNWKTTGAGGEDAILLVGHVPPHVCSVFESLGWMPSDFTFEEDGLKYD
jgi:mevalonate kinase